MKTPEKIRELLKKTLAERKVSQGKMAVEANVSYTTLSCFLRGLSVSESTLQKITAWIER